MRYLLSKDFVKIAETSGTVQNTSNGCIIEASQDNRQGNGILIYPLQKHNFKNTQLYLRCIDGWAEARVVPFELDAEGGDSVEQVIIDGTTYRVATNSEINSLLDNVFGKDD